MVHGLVEMVTWSPVRTFTISLIKHSMYQKRPGFRTASYLQMKRLGSGSRLCINIPGMMAHCYTLQLVWQHGNYTIHPNNSITLDPFKADGLQQFTNTCNHDKDRVEYYAQQEFMQGFDITTYKHLLADDAQWSYKLQLYNYDGSLKTPMYLAYRPALMFPPSPLHMTMIGFNDE